MYAIPEAYFLFLGKVMGGGAFDMSKYLYSSNFYVFWRMTGHDRTVFKQPSQYGHFTLWKCHFCNLGFKTGFKQSPLKKILCWKKIFRIKFLNSYDIRNCLRPKNEDLVFFPNSTLISSVRCTVWALFGKFWTIKKRVKPLKDIYPWITKLVSKWL